MTRIEAIRQRAERRTSPYGDIEAQEDMDALLTLWDTRETALRALVEQWNKEAALTGKANTAEEAFGLCVEALSRLLEQEP